MAMVVRANRESPGIGGHISTYASAATLLRDRLQPLLPRQGSRVGRRPGLLPGPRLSRHLRARVSGRAHHRDATRELPPRAAPGWRALVVSAPLAHADLLGVPHRLDGTRADHRDLSGAIQPLSGGPRAQSSVRAKVWAFLGDGETGRAGGARRDQPRLAREARQPDLRGQLQPAAPRRAGPRQRQDHPGARGELPRRGLERHQGHLGKRLGSSAGAGHRGRAGRIAWSPRWTASTRSTRWRTATTSASTSSAPTRAWRRWSRDLTDEEIRRLRRGGHDPEKVYAAYKAAFDHTGLAHRHPGQDDQGLRPRRGGRRARTSPTSRRSSTRRSCASSARASASRSPTRTWRQAPFYRPAEDSPEMRYLHERRKSLGGYLPERRANAPKLEMPRRGHLRRVHRGGRGQEMATTMAVRAHARQASARQEHRQAHRPHRPRRGAHLRHGGALPPGRHLLARRASSTSRWTGRRCSTTRKPPTDRSWRKGSPRRARCPRSSPPAPPTPRTA